MGSFKPVVAGQSVKTAIIHSDYNSMLRTARAFEESKLDQPGPEGKLPLLDYGQIYVAYKDNNDEDKKQLKRGEIVLLDTPFYAGDDDRFPNQVIMKCSDVGAVIAGKQFAVLLEPAAYLGGDAGGTIARALYSGVIPCKIKIKSTGHKYAKLLASDSEKFESAAIGPVKILWRQTVSVDEIASAYVLLGYGTEIRRAKVEATSIAADSSGSVKVWDSGTTDWSTTTETAYLPKHRKTLFKEDIVQVEQNSDENKLYIIDGPNRGHIRAKVVGDVLSGSGYVKLWDPVAGAYSSTNTTAYTVADGRPCFKDEIVFVEQNIDDGGLWQIVTVKNQVFFGKTQAALAKGTSADVKIYTASGTLTSYTITCYNTLGDISNDKIISFAWNGFRFEVVSGECD